MDMNGLYTLIGTYGFPVIACCVMAWYVKYTTDNHREEVNKLNEQHKTEMNDIKEALNNNTLALQKLTDYITRGNAHD